MKKIYIVDYLGVHCGMHYYLQSFKETLEKIPSVNIEVLSNYDCGNGQFFYNQYEGSKLNKISRLYKNLKKLKSLISNDKEAIFIYLTYGNAIDLAFINIISKSPFHIIDIHEAIAQDCDGNKLLNKLFKSVYSRKIKTIISHSTRTLNFMDKFNYKGTIFEVPHFRYVFKKDFELNRIEDDVKDCIRKDKLNILFFGNLTINKGVDLLIKAFNEVDEAKSALMNIVIAGKDFDGSININKPDENKNISIINRHINDDELVYLFENVDYLSLPYRKTSQSGILEMSFYFKRPIIASNIDYFRKVLSEFPSFGLLSDKDSESYSKTLSTLPFLNKKVFFKDDEYDRYLNRKETDIFIRQFSDWLLR